jgi:glycosyltransferase involved in cell wall biosynthesis
MALLGDLGHQVELASRFRSYDGVGDPLLQARLRQLGGRLVARLLQSWRGRPGPDLWFTYHLYHKAPDWLGPAVCDALDIPYVVAEASLAAKRAVGPWSAGYAASTAAIARADLVLAMTTNDLPALRGAVAPNRLTLFPPFLDAAPFASEPHPAPDPVPTLLAVAMMRADSKRDSYRLLAAALNRLTDLPWQIVLVGDGEARSEVEAMFAPFGERVVWRGAVPLEALAAIYAAADLLIWPACNEAYGMAILEAQASGLPVVAGREGGVPDVVADGATGLLTEPRSDTAFAASVRALLSDPDRRRRMGRAAREHVLARHDLSPARARLAAALGGLQIPACASA